MMTQKQIAAIQVLEDRVRVNTPVVANMIKVKDPVLVFIGAQYFDCLKKLAAEE